MALLGLGMQVEENGIVWEESDASFECGADEGGLVGLAGGGDVVTHKVGFVLVNEFNEHVVVWFSVGFALAWRSSFSSF